jgi:hypothetical protein
MGADAEQQSGESGDPLVSPRDSIRLNETSHTVVPSEARDNGSCLRHFFDAARGNQDPSLRSG